MSLNIFIYGKDAFAKEVKSVLVKSNVKYRLDAKAKIEHIKKLETLKEKISNNPDDIYLIEESKIIKKSLLNNKLGFLTPKDAIEEEYLKKYDIANLNISSYKDLAKYVNNKLEDLQVGELSELEEKERQSLEPAIKDSKKVKPEDESEEVLLETPEVLQGEEKPKEKEEDLGLSEDSIKENDEDEEKDKKTGEYVAKYKRFDDLDIENKKSKQINELNNDYLSDEETEDFISEPNFEEVEILSGEEVKQELDMNQNEEEKARDLDKFLQNTLGKQDDDLNNDLESSSTELSLENDNENNEEEKIDETENNEEEEIKKLENQEEVSEDENLEEAVEDENLDLEDLSKDPLEEPEELDEESINTDEKEDNENKINLEEDDKIELESKVENENEDDKKDDFKQELKVQEEGDNANQLDALLEEDIEQALSNLELPKKDSALSSAEDKTTLELDSGSMEEFFKNFKENLGNKDMEITIKVKK